MTAFRSQTLQSKLYIQNVLQHICLAYNFLQYSRTNTGVVGQVNVWGCLNWDLFCRSHSISWQALKPETTAPNVGTWEGFPHVSSSLHPLLSPFCTFHQLLICGVFGHCNSGISPIHKIREFNCWVWNIFLLFSAAFSVLPSLSLRDPWELIVYCCYCSQVVVTLLCFHVYCLLFKCISLLNILL